MLTIAQVLAAVLVAESPVMDGKLDDACWKTATWQGGMKETSFAVCFGADALHLAVRCTGEKAEDAVDFYFVPDGGTFDFYRFGLSSAAKATAAFYSEGGIIQPDPYGPVWSHAVQKDAKGWTAEATVPLTAFYMTRAAAWKKNWSMNVARTSGGALVSSWSSVEKKADELAKFRPLADVPKRPAGGDVAVRAVLAEIDRQEGGQLKGNLRFTFFAGAGGRYRVEAAGCGVVERDFRGEPNKVVLPCAFPSAGRHDVRFNVTAVGSGTVSERTYPVRVDFQPVRVKLTAPGYRNSFYPGQDVSKVCGTVRVSGGETAELTLEGPGFPKRQASVADGGTFSFDTKGFTTGEAWLTVKAGEATEKMRIRNLPPSGHRMAWIENGHIVVDGKPLLRRHVDGMYFANGLCMAERLKADEASFCLTPEFGRIGIEPMRLVPGCELKEGVYDVYPSPEVLKKIDACIAANRDKDFGSWFLTDEPECRNISPVWLRHLYDYIAERDPYHTIETDSRGGKAYLECFDVIQTHPYLAPVNGDNGTRTYSVPPCEIGSFLDAFEAEGRADKCLGIVPMCFAYRWTSIKNDYPTLAEYLCTCWAGMIRGGKAVSVYSGHDIGDRPQLYHGTRLFLQDVAALERILLDGKRTTLSKDKRCETCLYRLGDEQLVVAVNFTAQPLKAAFPGLEGNFRGFRGTRTFNFSTIPLSTVPPSVVLKPFETLLAVTGEPDKGLEPLADVVARVERLEYERTHRDNQLLERYNDIVFASNMEPNFGGGWYKLIDGTREMLAREASWRTNSFIEMSFPVFTPAFSKVRVWGSGLGGMTVSIRKGGVWRRLVPKASKTDKWMTELDFGETLTTVRLRLDLPGTGSPKNHVEVYEIELPRVPGATAAQRKVSAPVADVGVIACWSGTNCEASATYSYTQWNRAGSVVPRAEGGFTFVANTDRAFPSKTDPKWIVLDFAAIRPKPPGNQYRAWHFSIDPGGVIASLAGAAEEACVYTLELSKPVSDKQRWLALRDYGLDIDMNSISLMDRPANRVICRGPKDAKDIAPGDTIRVGVSFAEPCEEVAAEFLYAKALDNLRPFALNGASAIDLRPADDTGRNWAATIKVEKLPRAAAARTVYVKASALGGAFKRPLVGNFTVPFVLAHEE